MQWLAALCVRRPVFATVLILSLSVVGGFSFLQLGVDSHSFSLGDGCTTGAGGQSFV